MIWVSLLAIATAVVTGAMTWGMRRDASERRRQREADELAELIRELGPHDCRTIEAGTVTADKIKAGHVTLSGEPPRWPPYAMHQNDDGTSDDR